MEAQAPRTEQVKFRISREEKRALRIAAARRDTDVSTLCRDAAMREIATDEAESITLATETA